MSHLALALSHVAGSQFHNQSAAQVEQLISASFGWSDAKRSAILFFEPVWLQQISDAPTGGKALVRMVTLACLRVSHSFRQYFPHERNVRATDTRLRHEGWMGRLLQSDVELDPPVALVRSENKRLREAIEAMRAWITVVLAEDHAQGA